MFELGEDLFDWVEVRRVWGQEQQARAGASDCFADGRSLVAGEIVHDHDVARRERRYEELLDIRKEAYCVDWLIKDARCIDPVAAQGGQERHCSPMPVRNFGVQPAALGRPATQRRHVGFRPGFVDENEPPGVNPALVFLPLLAPPGDLGSQLFGRQYAFF